MSVTWIRFAALSLACMALACSSSPVKVVDGATDPGGPVRGEVSPLDVADARDAEAGDAVAHDGDAADLVAEMVVDVPPDVPVIVDVPPEMPPDMPPDIPKPPSNLPNGQPCQMNSWCRSTFCIDGFCCNSTCESQDPMRCNACSMAKTGQNNGVCAPDRSRERMKCGEACGQVLMNVPAVLTMVCLQGTCRVPEVPVIVDTCRKAFDNCTTSFCDQPASGRTARCVHTLCQQAGTCCCQAPANPAARSCVAVNACNNDRMCVSQ
jgi:hypothetical protein